MLCIPEGSEVQSQSLVVGCAPLSLPVPFFYRKILSVMIHHWITLVIHMFFSIELLAGYKRKLNFLYKVIPHGKVFFEFLTKYFVGCLQCHQSLYACLWYIALFVWLGLFMIDKFAIWISDFFGFTCLMLTIYDQIVCFASFYPFPMSNMLCVCLRKESNIKESSGWNPTTSWYGECHWATK